MLEGRARLKVRGGEALRGGTVWWVTIGAKDSAIVSEMMGSAKGICGTAAVVGDPRGREAEGTARCGALVGWARRDSTQWRDGRRVAVGDRPVPGAASSDSDPTKGGEAVVSEAGVEVTGGRSGQNHEVKR